MKNFRFYFLTFIFLSGLATLPIPAWAKKAKTTEPPPEYLQRLEDLEQRQKILERNLELKEEELQAQKKEGPKLKVGTEGVSLSSADGNNELKIRGLIQADARFYIERDGVGAVNTFILRRVRPYLEGKFAKHWEFRIMPDFGEGKVQLIDAYIDTVVFPEFKIRLGKYREPIGLERLEQAANLHFVERGLPVNLVPNRDLGAMIHGKISDGVFEYQLGIFNGVPDGASSDFDLNAAKDFAGRVFAHPFKSTSVEAAQGLGIGISGSVGTQSGSATNPNLPSYKTAGQNTFFSYLNDGTPEGTSIANGNRFRVSPQGYYYYRGFGLLGEYVLSSQNVALGPDSAQVQNTSWQIASSYVIGADNSYGAIKPRKPLGWKKGGTGAFEFAARYEELSVDPDAFPIFADPNRAARKARAWAGGFNWIINENIKFMLNFEQTRFDGGAANGGNRPTENAILNRYQINF